MNLCLFGLGKNWMRNMYFPHLILWTERVFMAVSTIPGSLLRIDFIFLSILLPYSRPKWPINSGAGNFKVPQVYSLLKKYILT